MSEANFDAPKSKLIEFDLQEKLQLLLAIMDNSLIYSTHFQELKLPASDINTMQKILNDRTITPGRKKISIDTLFPGFLNDLDEIIKNFGNKEKLMYKLTALKHQGSR